MAGEQRAAADNMHFFYCAGLFYKGQVLLRPLWHQLTGEPSSMRSSAYPDAPCASKLCWHGEPAPDPVLHSVSTLEKLYWNYYLHKKKEGRDTWCYGVVGNHRSASPLGNLERFPTVPSQQLLPSKSFVDHDLQSLPTVSMPLSGFKVTSQKIPHSWPSPLLQSDIIMDF